MKKVKALKKFEYHGINVYVGAVLYIYDQDLEPLKEQGIVEELSIPENRIHK